ncbi:hypothetical protein ACWEFL_01605 [Streptomyces sp. NPDC004838]
MNTFLAALAVIALGGVVLLPSLLGHARDRAVDRQLRAAERGDPVRSSRESPARRTVHPGSASIAGPARRGRTGSRTSPRTVASAERAPSAAEGPRLDGVSRVGSMSG